jgi:hypothetical protein
MIARLTVVAPASDPDPFPVVLANLTNAEADGLVAPGLTRRSLAGLQLDMPEAYLPPTTYRFGMAGSLAITFTFCTQDDPVTSPEEIIWFDPSIENVVPEVTTDVQSVAIGALVATTGRWRSIVKLQ